MTDDINGINGKPWRCPEGHLLGHVQRRNNIRYLFMAMIVEPDGNILVLRITGQAEIQCPECGQVRTWFPGDEAIKDLVDRSARMKVE